MGRALVRDFPAGDDLLPCRAGCRRPLEFLEHCAQSVPENPAGKTDACRRWRLYSIPMQRKATKAESQPLSRAFHRPENAPPLLQAIASARKRCRGAARKTLDVLGGWVLAPLTLWPVQIDDLVRWVLDQLGAPGGRLSEETQLLVHLLGPAPTSIQPALIAHEFQSQTGDYKVNFPQQWRKFEVEERNLRVNRPLQKEWRSIKDAFDIDAYRDRKGMIRRSMLAERNFRPDWHLDLGDVRARFQAVFDTFCWRWNLYGMDGEEPMLGKPTVSATPLGTLIFIPRYWQVDPRRDLAWSVIRKLHKSLGAPSRRRAQAKSVPLLEESENAWRWDQKARDLGLKGGLERRQVRGVSEVPLGATQRCWSNLRRGGSPILFGRRWPCWRIDHGEALPASPWQ